MKSLENFCRNAGCLLLSTRVRADAPWPVAATAPQARCSMMPMWFCSVTCILKRVATKAEENDNCFHECEYLLSSPNLKAMGHQILCESRSIALYEHPLLSPPAQPQPILTIYLLAAFVPKILFIWYPPLMWWRRSSVIAKGNWVMWP